MTWNQLLFPVLKPTSLGAGATGLKTIATTTLTVPIRAMTIVGTSAYLHQLRAGADADNSPTIIRPTDWAAVTNEKVWELVTINSAVSVAFQVANDFSELSTTTKRSNARGNLEVLWKDDQYGLFASRSPRGGLRFAGTAATDLVTGAPGTGLALGLADFTITGTLRFDIYPPTASTTVITTHGGGQNFIQLYVNTSGAFVCRMDNGGAQTDFVFTPDVALVVGETYHFALVGIRAGLATLYINASSDRDRNATLVTQSIASFVAVDVGSGNGSGYKVGTAFPGTIFSLRAYNRALSANDVLGLVKRGYVDVADQWSTVASIISPTVLNGGMETAGGGGADALASWTEAVAGSSTVTRDTSTFNSGAASAKMTMDSGPALAQITNGGTTVGKRYFLSLWAKSDVAATILFADSAGTVQFALTTSWALYSVEYIPTLDTSLLLKRGSNSASKSIWIDDVTLRSIGCFFDLEFDQANPLISLTIRDRAGVYDGTISAAGVTQVNTIKQANYERLRTLKSLHIGIDSIGTNADKTLIIGSGTLPGSSPADAVQLSSSDRGGTAGKASLFIRTEDGTQHCLGDWVGIGTTSPLAQLHVNAGTNLRALIRNGVAGTGGVPVGTTGLGVSIEMSRPSDGADGNCSFFVLNDQDFGLKARSNYRLFCLATEVFTILQNGNVGINNVAPAAAIDCNGFIQWAGQKRVTSQFDAAANTTLANVTGLSVSLAAGKTYHFRAFLDIAASAIGGSKFAIAGTATATSVFYWITLIDGSTNANTINSRQNALAGSAGQAGTTAGQCEIEGVITVNGAGTFTVQFAQQAANGTSSVLIGSILIVEQIA